MTRVFDMSEEESDDKRNVGMERNGLRDFNGGKIML